MGKKLLAFGISTLLTLFLCEMALRAFQRPRDAVIETPKTEWAIVPERIWTEYHPELGWYHELNKTAVSETPNFKVEVHTNSQGLRGTKEYSIHKPEGTRRVVILGDSFTFGFGVPDDATFSRLLEESHPAVEAMNFGVPGYGIDQILVLYRILAKKYEAENVLIMIFPEMFWRATRSFADSGHAKPYFILDRDGKLQEQNIPVPKPYTLKSAQFPKIRDRGPIETILGKSILYQFVESRVTRLKKSLGVIDPDMTDEWIVGREILKELIGEIRAENSRPVMVIIPPRHWAESERKTSLRKSLEKFATREAVDFLDLTPVFYETGQHSSFDELYIPGDGHWTEQGHALAAREIANLLKLTS